MTAYDRRLALHTLVVFGLCVLAAAGVMWLTDEAVSTRGMRAARLAAMAPGFGIVAILVVDGVAQGRGEASALESLGVSPWKRLAGPICAMWSASALACGMLLLPSTDLRALFPVVVQPASWEVTGDVFRFPGAGIVIGPDGWPWFREVPASVRAHAVGSHAAALALCAPLAVTAPVWASMPARTSARCLTVLCVGGLAVFLLHAVAAGRAPSWVGVLATAPLVAHAAPRVWRWRAMLLRT